MAFATAWRRAARLRSVCYLLQPSRPTHVVSPFAALSTTSATTSATATATAAAAAGAHSKASDAASVAPGTPPLTSPATTAEASESTTKAHLASDDTSWVRDYATRAIAHHLLAAPRNIMQHDALYTAVDAMGILNSRIHFKHCLKMMREKARVHVVCLGVQRVGSSKRVFGIKLTERGQVFYAEQKERGGSRHDVDTVAATKEQEVLP